MERKLITSDCHIGPPFSLVDQLPESYREYFARLESRADGRYLNMPITPGMSRLMGGDGTAGGFAVKLDDDDPRAEAKAAFQNNCPEAEPSFDAAEVLADLERDGVYGAVLIGRISVFDNGTPPEVDAAYCQVVNDWMAETWGPYLDRVAPGMYLPYKDPVLCAKEIERAAAMGLRPALLPDGIHDQPYHSAEWEPVWEICNALKIPITMHVGGLRNPPREHTLFPGFSYVGWYNQCVGMGETLGWLTFSGVFERYPDLHVVMTEGYAAWLGFAMQFFDHHWSDSRYSSMAMNLGPTAAKLERAAELLLEAPGPRHLHVGPAGHPGPQLHQHRLSALGQRLPASRGVVPVLGAMEREAVRRCVGGRHRCHGPGQRGPDLRHHRLSSTRIPQRGSAPVRRRRPGGRTHRGLEARRSRPLDAKRPHGSDRIRAERVVCGGTPIAGSRMRTVVERGMMTRCSCATEGASNVVSARDELARTPPVRPAMARG